MRALPMLLLMLAGCLPPDPNGIYQYTMTGDIAAWHDGYCSAGTINGTAQAQVSGDATTLSADASTSCTIPPCDNIPCYRTINFDCTFSGADVTCTPRFSNTNTIGGVFALGKCTDTSCSITSPPILDTYTNIDIEMTRQR